MDDKLHEAKKQIIEALNEELPPMEKQAASAFVFILCHIAHSLRMIAEKK